MALIAAKVNIANPADNKHRGAHKRRASGCSHVAFFGQRFSSTPANWAKLTVAARQSVLEGVGKLEY